MTETVKIKRNEIGPEKEKLREEIYDIAGKLYQRTTVKMAIPRHVVDGTYSEVIAYKEKAQEVIDCYHVNAPPGASLSLNKLTCLRNKLRRMLNILQGISHEDQPS